jgi:hypothetical protein
VTCASCAIKARNIRALADELDQLRSRMEGTRSAIGLALIWQADAWRWRHTADAYRSQIVTAGIRPTEPDIPDLPTPTTGRTETWISQIERAREAAE